MAKKDLLNWIELSRGAIDKNINSLARLAPGRIMAVCVKANAYGHGLTEVVGLLRKNSHVNYLTVHSLDEAIRCRDAGWTRKIMLLGPIALDMTEAVLRYDLEPVIFNRDFLIRLGRTAKKHDRQVCTHLKLETGTHRLGVTEKNLPAFAKIYHQYPSVIPYGASTHFANIEDTTSHDYAEYQLANFERMLRQLAKLKIKPTVRHTASSAATILFRKTHFEMVRPGIAVYGLWPSKETYLSYRLLGGENDLFEPVLGWKTRVSQIKQLPADSYIGYGRTYRTTSPARIAVLPIGYYDGYDRALSNHGHVLIRGRRAPIRGRICMNITMADITDIKQVRFEEEVTIIGSGGSETITADTLADWARTINYEILARISPEMPRTIVK